MAPQPCGTMSATDTSPALTAASAVAACSQAAAAGLLWTRVVVVTVSEPSLSRPLTSCARALALVFIDHNHLIFGTVSCWPPKMTAKMERRRWAQRS
jgi:hypothetical protein